MRDKFKKNLGSSHANTWSEILCILFNDHSLCWNNINTIYSANQKNYLMHLKVPFILFFYFIHLSLLRLKFFWVKLTYNFTFFIWYTFWFGGFMPRKNSKGQLKVAWVIWERYTLKHLIGATYWMLMTCIINMLAYYNRVKLLEVSIMNATDMQVVIFKVTQNSENDDNVELNASKWRKHTYKNFMRKWICSLYNMFMKIQLD